MSVAVDTTRPVLVRAWLFCVALLILLLVVVGGATRLTDSGLSITQWQPLLGVLPPLGEADWQAAFAQYQTIPEYELVNEGMSLAEFQVIYWWEWTHRLLARGVGLAFALPMLLFWVRGWLSRPLLLRLAGILALGGLQGAVGWYMVMSGLSERVDVSQYRLALHLGLAVLIYSAVLWTAFGIGRRWAGPEHRPGSPGVLRIALLLAAAIFLQILLGAFVAGMDAGLSHNTWPLMDGRIVPDGLLAMSPWWVNLFENAATVQFDHRMLAYVVLALAFADAGLARRDGGPLRGRARLLLAAVTVQVGLGILTLLSVVRIELALAHQALAMLLMGLSLWQLDGLVRVPRPLPAEGLAPPQSITVASSNTIRSTS